MYILSYCGEMRIFWVATARRTNNNTSRKKQAKSWFSEYNIGHKPKAGKGVWDHRGQ